VAHEGWGARSMLKWRLTKMPGELQKQRWMGLANGGALRQLPMLSCGRVASGHSCCTGRELPQRRQNTSTGLCSSNGSRLRKCRLWGATRQWCQLDGTSRGLRGARRRRLHHATTTVGMA